MSVLTFNPTSNTPSRAVQRGDVYYYLRQTPATSIASGIIDVDGSDYWEIDAPFECAVVGPGSACGWYQMAYTDPVSSLRYEVAFGPGAPAIGRFPAGTRIWPRVYQDLTTNPTIGNATMDMEFLLYFKAPAYTLPIYRPPYRDDSKGETVPAYYHISGRRSVAVSLGLYNGTGGTYNIRGQRLLYVSGNIELSQLFFTVTLASVTNPYASFHSTEMTGFDFLSIDFTGSGGGLQTWSVEFRDTP